MSDRNRMNGKIASDALKSGNNSGMLYLKQTKAIAPLFVTSPLEAVRQVSLARAHLRVAEKAVRGDLLRSYAGHKR
jgi:hypothetical protein